MKKNNGGNRKEGQKEGLEESELDKKMDRRRELEGETTQIHHDNNFISTISAILIRLCSPFFFIIQSSIVGYIHYNPWS